MPGKANTTVKRFFSSFDAPSMEECWLWKRLIGSHGYGLIYGAKKERLAHRLMWEITNGVIKPGFHILHKCDVRSCCNPNHLFIGTQKDNMVDCAKKGRCSNQNVGKKICKNGHSPEWRVYKGSRYCKACKRMRSRKNYKEVVSEYNYS